MHSASAHFARAFRPRLWPFALSSRPDCLRSATATSISADLTPSTLRGRVDQFGRLTWRGGIVGGHHVGTRPRSRCSSRRPLRSLRTRGSRRSSFARPDDSVVGLGRGVHPRVGALWRRMPGYSSHPGWPARRSDSALRVGADHAPVERGRIAGRIARRGLATSVPRLGPCPPAGFTLVPRS